MLLKEVQKQYHRAEAKAEVIKSQEQKIEALEQRLSRLWGCGIAALSQVGIRS